MLLADGVRHRRRNDCHEGRSFYTYTSLETKSVAGHTGPHRKAPEAVRRQREGVRGELWTRSLYCGFHRRVGRGGVNSNLFKLTSLDNFSRLLGIGPNPSHLYLALGR